MNNKFQKIHLELLMSSVFLNLLNKPLFKYFSNYVNAKNQEEKINFYAKFVAEIYNDGASLTDLVSRLVFEDENVYIKKRANFKSIDLNIKTALDHELQVLSKFASLKSEDFKSDMGLEYVSPFDSREVNLCETYKERIVNIKKYGYGIFSQHGMFRISDNREIEPIVSADKVDVSSFVGYEFEREKVINNTRAFIEGRPAANTLLYGDAGTGKSSTVKAVANMFFDDGIRLIELRKDQLSLLPFIMGKISENPLKFIIFIDDLSFNQSDDNFSMLKAALEGSASAKAENAVIYATSNRRHIVRESFKDRDGDDVHRNDTIQETLSLSERFGLTVMFQRPNKNLYIEIVHELAKRNGIKKDNSALDIEAEAFALKKGNRSPRCAEQFVRSLM